MSKDLMKLLERLSEDDAFRERVEKDPGALKELGLSPELTGSFTLGKAASRSSCGSICGCVPESGAGCKPNKPGYCCDSDGGSQYN